MTAFHFISHLNTSLTHVNPVPGYNFEQKTVPSTFNFGGGNVTFGSP